MFRKVVFITLVFMAFSVCAFAGEGSDTIGACKMLPELRYSYLETDLTLDRYPYDYEITRLNDWRTREHNTTMQLNWGVIDNLDLYTFVGAKIAAETVGKEDIAGGEFRRVLDVGTGFICGVGVKGTFWRSPGGFYAGGGLSFAYSVTDDRKHYRAYANDSLMLDYTWVGVYFRETSLTGTADLHAGWHFKNIGLTPYLGVEYRWLRNDVEFVGNVPHTTYVYHAEKPVGVYVGLDYMIKDKLYLNLEGHMINRWGGSFSIGYLFDICGKPTPAPPVTHEEPKYEPKLEPMSKN